MNYYDEIKEKLINNEIVKKVKDYSKNRSDLNTYFEVGRLLSLAGKSYGDGIVKRYSIKLTNELGKKYDVSTLKRMRQFFLVIEKGATLWHQLSWSHYRELLPIKDINEINYYIQRCINLNLSQRQLVKIIKSKEYERLDDKTKNKLINKEDISISDFIKNPVIIKNKYNTDKISEKMLKELILDDIDIFLKELGDGFALFKKEIYINIT